MTSRMFLLVSLLWLAHSTFSQSPDPADRLPTYITPVNYAIHLEPDMDSSTVKGSVSITFNTTNNLSVPMTSVVMHLGLDVFVEESSVTLLELTGQVKSIGAIEYDDAHTLIKVVLPEGDTLQHDQWYMISLQFTSLLYSEPTGLFTGFINSTSRYIASNFRPTFARNVFPCFDEPHFKVPVSLKVLRPPTYIAVSTAPRKDSSKTITGVLDTFEATSPISIHSLGLFISEISPVDSPMGVKLYAPPGSPTSVPFLQTLLTNIKTTVGPFPVTPLNLVVLPDHLQMHLASYGFIFISSDIYGYNEDDPSYAAHVWSSLQLQLSEAFLRQFLEFSKTPMWWSHLWLSESVGAYLAASMQPEVFPWLKVETRSQVLGVDFNDQMPPVVDSKLGCHWAIEKAVTSQYIRNKGFGVLSMWSDTLPVGTVFKTVIDYIKLGKSLVTTEDFLEVLVNNIESNKTYDVTPAVKGLPVWLNSSGYPMITYFAQSDNSFQLTQTPESSSDNSKLWPVSVSLVQNNSRDWDHYRWGLWLLNVSSSFSPSVFVGNQWTILNLESGLYRVNYNQSWGTILDALKTDLVPITTPDLVKATIQDDAVALSLQDSLPFSNAFAVLTSTQRYMLDWFPVAKTFEAFSNKIANDDDIYDEYKMFARSLFSKELLADLDLQNRPADTRIQYIRSIMTPWLCQFDIGNFRQVVAKLFDQILQGDIHNIDAGDLENVACYGVQYNSSILPSLISAYVNTNSLQLKNVYTIGLGCVTDAPSVERLLNLLVNSTTPIANSDAKRIIVSLASKIANSAKVVDFISQQASNIQSVLGSGCLADVLQTLANFRIDMSKIEYLTNDPSLDPYVVHSALRAIGRTNASWAWWSANAVELDAALPQKHKTTTTTTTASPSPSSSVSMSISVSTSVFPDTSSASPSTRTTLPPTTPSTTTTTSGTTSWTSGTSTITTNGTTTVSTNGTTSPTTFTTTAQTNGTTSDTTVTIPPTQQTTSATTGSTPIPSSSPESLSNVTLLSLIVSLAVMVFSTSL